MYHTLKEELEEKVVGRINNEPTESPIFKISEETFEKKQSQKVINDNWVKRIGATLHECACFLKKTNGGLSTEFAEERSGAEKEIEKIELEAKKRKVTWQRVLNSAFIARIKSCPIPSPEKPTMAYVSIKEIHDIVYYLTTHPHHCKKKYGTQEVPMYRWANYDDRTKINHSIKKIGRPPIGCRMFEGRWLYPNSDPLTHGKTKYQEAVEVTFGNLIQKYCKQIRKINKQEVHQMENSKAQNLKGVLDGKQGQYFVKNRNGCGALLVRGFYKNFHNINSKKTTEVFVIAITEAVGEYRNLAELAGFYIPIYCAENRFVPKNVPSAIKGKVKTFALIMHEAFKKIK